MIYINQLGHQTLGWGETKEKAFESVTLFCPDLSWEMIKDHTSIFGECYWSELPEDQA